MLEQQRLADPSVYRMLAAVAVQQDAQEFNKLLLSFLEELDPKASKLPIPRLCTGWLIIQTPSAALPRANLPRPTPP